MTETTGGSILTMPGDNKTGHVGGPVANCKVRLRDIPESGYLSTDVPARGEICFAGSSIMTGYFNEPQKTAEAVINGWMHSGDVGIVHANGQIQVIDRVKNIFKLSQGEYISPEKIENVFVQSSFLLMSFVTGDSTKDFCVVVGVVDPAKAAKFAGVEKATDEQLKDPAFVEAVLKDLYEVATKNRLNSLEKPKQIWLTYELFDAEKNEILTTTAKMKRNVARAYFKKEIEEMYAAGPHPFTVKE